MQCFLCEIPSTHGFPNAKTKQKMPQQFQFLCNCRRRGAGLAGARLRHWTRTQDVGTAFILEPRCCTRSAHLESSLLRKTRRGGCSFLPGGSIRNTVSLTPETDAEVFVLQRAGSTFSGPHTTSQQSIWQHKMIQFFIFCKEFPRYAWFLSTVKAPFLVENQNGWSFCVAVMVDLFPTHTVTCCGFKRRGFWEMTLLTFCYLRDQCFDLEEQLKDRSFENNILKHQLYPSILNYFFKYCI